MFRNLLKKNINSKNILTKKFSTNSNSNNFDNKKLLFQGIFAGTSILSSYVLLKGLNNRANIKKLSMKDFKEIHKSKEISDMDNFEKVTIIDNSVAIIKEKNKEQYYRINIPNGEYFEKNIEMDIPIYYEESIKWESFLGPMLSLGIFGTVLFMMSRNAGGLKSIVDLNKSTEIMKNIETKFSDVIGQKNARRSVEEFVDILKNKKKYSDIGVKVPKGALLSGPPGTGKTLIAKAIAGESNLPFVNMTGSDFNAMFVGVGSAKIKNLYKTAKNAAEEHGGCIVFIDEIDAIGQKRSSANTFGGNSERENTLNQLLTEMDGFDSNRNVITFAATNRPELLDPALLRPGRFDRKIIVDLPNINDRKKLFEYYLEKLNIDKKIIPEVSEISSKLTPGFSGADIANIVNESGIISVRNKRDTISENDIKSAIDYVMLGDEKENLLLQKEKEIVSYHEAGHAYMSTILPLVEKPVKVSIIPREKGMLGFSQSEISMENLISKKKMEQYIIVLMAGRACEEIFFDDITNGASNDIEKATEIAKNYVKLYGFSKNNKFMNMTDNNPYKDENSDLTKNTTDGDTLSLLNEKYEETLDLIIKNKDNIEAIKNDLIENETIYFNDIDKVIDKDKIILN